MIGGGVPSEIRTFLSARRSAIVWSLVAGIVPVALTWPLLAPARYPWGGETYSNLVPIVLARQQLAAGSVPLYSELFFGGRYLFLDPLWKGFYPGAWVLFVPTIPLPTALDLTLAVHLAAPAVVSYLFLRNRLRTSLAILFAILWALPIASHVPVHHEKIFAWPWCVLAAIQLLPPRLENSPRHAGLLAGVGIGVGFLAGGNYYGVYTGALVGLVLLSTRSWAAIKMAIVGGLVGLPHYLTLGWLVLMDTSRPPVAWAVQPLDVIWQVSGLSLTPFVHSAHFPQSYAVIGPFVLLLSLAGTYSISTSGSTFERRWLLGLLGASVLGWLLAIAWPPLYQLPGVSGLRTTGRATILVSMVALLLAIYGTPIVCHYLSERVETWTKWRESTPRALATLLVCLLLVSSVATASIGWVQMTSRPDPVTSTPDAEMSIAASLDRLGCDAAWIAVRPAWDPRTTFGADHRAMAFALAKHGIGIRSMQYGAIGQDWDPVRPSGELTFDVLLTGSPPPNGTVTLSKTNRPAAEVATLNRERFTLAKTYDTSGYKYQKSESNTVYAYTTDRC